MPFDAHRKPKTAVRKLILPLLSWFSANARDLPWRRTRDPYAIWVSEIMLQQTQVKTVIPYWECWMRELPTIQSVAKVSPARLHKLWEGLGYYTRVRNLQKAAQEIIARHNGKFPEDFDDILALPGIGRYTAGAIASLAFNQSRPILDGNVIRVLTRIFGIATDPREKKTNAHLWQLATELVFHASGITHHARREKSRARTSLREAATRQARTKDKDDAACSDLNQSLMELGALVCTPRSPNCSVCPVKTLCVAFHDGKQETLPVLGQRSKTTARHFVVFVVERNGKFLVRQRPTGVVNAHLWEFPNVEVAARPSGLQHVRMAARRLELKHACTKPLCTIKHSITRYRITLEAYHANPENAPLPGGKWFSLQQMHEVAFSSAHKKILARLQDRC